MELPNRDKPHTETSIQTLTQKRAVRRTLGHEKRERERERQGQRQGDRDSLHSGPTPVSVGAGENGSNQASARGPVGGGQGGEGAWGRALCSRESRRSFESEDEFCPRVVGLPHPCSSDL